MGRRTSAQRMAVGTAWALSLSRLVFACLFPFVSRSWGLVLVVLAAASDGLDGLVARRLGARTQWGAVLDPVTDKVFTWTVLGMLVARDALAAPWLIPLLSRDAVVLGGSVWMAARWGRAGLTEVKARWSGKVATVALFALFLVLLAWPRWEDSSALVAAAAVIMAASAADYGWHIRRLSRRRETFST